MPLAVTLAANHQLIRVEGCQQTASTPLQGLKITYGVFGGADGATVRQIQEMTSIGSLAGASCTRLELSRDEIIVNLKVYYD